MQRLKTAAKRVVHYLFLFGRLKPKSLPEKSYATVKTICNDKNLKY